ncbi:hypothetical protein GW17_00020384, partial [Ensete ventricosum]
MPPGLPKSSQSLAVPGLDPLDRDPTTTLGRSSARIQTGARRMGKTTGDGLEAERGNETESVKWTYAARTAQKERCVRSDYERVSFNINIGLELWVGRPALLYAEVGVVHAHMYTVGDVAGENVADSFSSMDASTRRSLGGEGKGEGRTEGKEGRGGEGGRTGRRGEEEEERGEGGQEEERRRAGKEEKERVSGGER